MVVVDQELVVVVEEPLASGEVVRHGAEAGEGDARRVREAHALGEARVIVRGVAAAVEEEEEVQVVAVGRRGDASVGVRPSARGRLQGVVVRRGDGRDLARATLRRGSEKTRAHGEGAGSVGRARADIPSSDAAAGADFFFFFFDKTRMSNKNNPR